jgi:hypothetical protein
VDLHRGVALLQLLAIRVHGDKVDLGDAGVHHPVHRIQPGTADTDDADDRQVGGRVGTRRVMEARRGLGHRLQVATGGRLPHALARRLGRSLRLRGRHRHLDLGGRRGLRRLRNVGRGQGRRGTRLRRKIGDVLDRLLEGGLGTTVARLRPRLFRLGLGRLRRARRLGIT